MKAASCLPCLLALAAAAAQAATIEQPRAFGHVIGDVLTQRVLMQQEGQQEGQQDGRELVATALPAPERVGLWFERRPARIEHDSAGRPWLAIDYQVINSPRALSTASLPALVIPVDAGAPLALPEWPVSIGPLTPPETFAQGALQPMRPDREVAPIPTASIERNLRLSTGALLLVLLSWLGWWSARQWRETRSLPYARALGELRRLDANADEAWLVLHRAIDASCGRVVRSEGLPRLFADAPQLLPLRTRLEEFYRRSDRRFFADERNTAPYPLMELCRALREIEKRRER